MGLKFFLLISDWSMHSSYVLSALTASEEDSSIYPDLLSGVACIRIKEPL